jgi:hypothetical protein
MFAMSTQAVSAIFAFKGRQRLLKTFPNEIFPVRYYPPWQKHTASSRKRAAGSWQTKGGYLV